jgi:tRNA U34 5-methylaminomethyl-2-thiouridine-forming methyltransferase MnmC
VIGPIAEAEALYVKQIRLLERIQHHQGEFVLWDVGLGAAANVLAVLRATRAIACSLRIISFDHTLAPLKFAMQHTEALGYIAGFEEHLAHLLRAQRVSFKEGSQQVDWSIQSGDFPTLLAKPQARELAKPHAIMYDAFSPAKNPAMWTAPVFASLFNLLEPTRSCTLPTYSRSTMLRVTLLLAGFFVGVGHATGEKEETTIAANSLELICEPLDTRWLERVYRSTSAEPMWEPIYRQAPLSMTTWKTLQQHKQFSR